MTTIQKPTSGGHRPLDVLVDEALAYSGRNVLGVLVRLARREGLSPASQLRLLAETQHYRIRTALAGNRSITLAAQEVLWESRRSLRNGSDSALQRLAANPSAHSSIQERLVTLVEEGIWHHLAKNRNLLPHLQERLATEGSAWVVSALASRSTLEAAQWKVVERFSKKASIRSRLVRNSALSVKLQEQLIVFPGFARLLLERTGLAVSAQEVLVVEKGHTRWFARLAPLLAENESVGLEQQVVLSFHEDSTVRSKLMWNSALVFDTRMRASFLVSASRPWVEEQVVGGGGDLTEFWGLMANWDLSLADALTAQQLVSR